MLRTPRSCGPFSTRRPFSARRSGLLRFTPSKGHRPRLDAVHPEASRLTHNRTTRSTQAKDIDPAWTPSTLRCPDSRTTVQHVQRKHRSRSQPVAVLRHLGRAAALLAGFLSGAFPSRPRPAQTPKHAKGYGKGLAGGGKAPTAATAEGSPQATCTRASRLALNSFFGTLFDSILTPRFQSLRTSTLRQRGFDLPSCVPDNRTSTPLGRRPP